MSSTICGKNSAVKLKTHFTIQLTMRIVITLFGVMLILMLFGGMLAAIHAFRGSDFTEPHIVATTSGQTSVTITLASDVLDGDNTNVTVTSSNQQDAPVPFAYDAANRQLTVGGLNPSDTRTLTITYPVAQLDGFTDTAARLMPAYIILAAICAVGGSIYLAFKRGDD
jgi:ABC-type multidrug transport system permease subunit